jgi:carbon monoxide dehydrogenase subunit G
MRVTYSGVIAASPDDAWARIRDIDMIIGLLPGASLKRDGDRVVGSLKLRPSSQVTYRITCGASEDAEAEKAATIALTGAEARGDGTLAATLTVAVTQEDGGSGLAATADIEATGRAADADEHGWTRVLTGLGNAVVASFERIPAGTPPPPPLATEPEPEPAPEPEAVLEPEPEPEPEPDVVADLEPEPEPAPEPVADIEVEAELEAEPEPELEPDPSPAPALAAVDAPAPQPTTPIYPSSAVTDAPAQSKAPMVIGAIVVLLVLRWILKRRK